MAPYGRIIGIDPGGDYRVRSEDGRTVVLKGSRGDPINLGYGHGIEYTCGNSGKNVVFAKTYKAGEPDNNTSTLSPRGGLSTKAGEDLPSLIQRILSKVDASGITAILIYDSLNNDNDFYFITIAKTKENAELPIELLSKLGFNPQQLSYCHSINRLHGFCYKAKGDLKSITSEKTRKDILFLPIAGIASRDDKLTGIDPDIFRRCVESAGIEAFIS